MSSIFLNVQSQKITQDPQNVQAIYSEIIGPIIHPLPCGILNIKFNINIIYIIRQAESNTSLKTDIQN